MAVISYLVLDSAYDINFNAASALNDADAVAQAVMTRLKLFYGEWWEDLTLGLPVFQSMLSQLGSQKTLAAIQNIIARNIAGAPYVTGVNNVQVAFANGRLSFSAAFQTIFGPAEISNVPGAQASLEAV